MLLLLLILSVLPKIDSTILGGNIAWVLRFQGETVAENYPESYPRLYQHHVHSVTKSVTSLLIGIAIELDLIPDVDTPLTVLFPDYDYLIDSPTKGSIRLRDILSMTSGLYWRGGIGGTDLIRMVNSGDWTAAVLKRPMVFVPGKVFNYNSGGTQLLSVLIQRAFNGTTKQFADDYLFSPMGIENWTWDYLPSPDGITAGAWGLYMTVEDMGRLGELVLNNGECNGIEIVPEEWITESTSTQIDRPGLAADYGYQWWLPRDLGDKAICARGWYGDHYAYIYIFPNIDLVLATAGELPDEDGIEELVSIFRNIAVSR
jgi:CubicO group peptidase (beta-lactamase class C family)